MRKPHHFLHSWFALLNALIIINHQWIHQCLTFIILALHNFRWSYDREKRNARIHTFASKMRIHVQTLVIKHKWIMTLVSNVLSPSNEFIVSYRFNKLQLFFFRWGFSYLPKRFFSLSNCQFITVTLKSTLIS